MTPADCATNAKVLDVEARECQDCAHFLRLTGCGSICRKHMMAVHGKMHVTYKVADGSCWTAPDLAPPGVGTVLP